MAKKFTVPNWAQALIARAVDLDPNKVAVEHDDDRCIVFQQYLPHCTVTVGKINGTVIRKDGSCGNQ